MTPTTHKSNLRRLLTVGAAGLTIGFAATGLAPYGIATLRGVSATASAALTASPPAASQSGAPSNPPAATPQAAPSPMSSSTPAPVVTGMS